MAFCRDPRPIKICRVKGRVEAPCLTYHTLGWVTERVNDTRFQSDALASEMVSDLSQAKQLNLETGFEARCLSLMISSELSRMCKKTFQVELGQCGWQFPT